MDRESFKPKPAPNYTNAFLTVMGGLIFMSLWLIAGLFGFIWVILSAAFAEALFRARRSRS